MSISKILTLFCTVSAVIILTAVQSLAGAWTMPAGTFYDRFTFNFYYAGKNFNESGNRENMPFNGDFTDINLNNYLEYGITDRFTLINSMYFKHIEREDDYRAEKTYGIGDIDLGVRAKLAEGSLGILSLQGLVKIPAAYDRHDSLPLGNGQYDLEWRLLYGRSLWPLIPGYYNFELGYRVRFEAPADEFRYLLEIGSDFTDNIYGRVKLDGIKSMNNGNSTDSSDNPTTTNNFDLGKLDVTLGYKLTKALKLEAGYTPALYGWHTSAGSTYSLSLSFQTN